MIIDYDQLLSAKFGAADRPSYKPASDATVVYDRVPEHTSSIFGAPSDGVYPFTRSQGYDVFPVGGLQFDRFYAKQKREYVAHQFAWGRFGAHTAKVNVPGDQ